MRTIVLYSGMGASLTPLYVEGRTRSAYIRLVADEGKAITNGIKTADCIDILSADVENWYEIDAPQEEEEISDSDALSIIIGEEV